MRWAYLTLAVALGCALARAQGPVMPPADPPAKASPLPLPNDALALAVADLETLPEGARPFTRYVWVTDGDHEAMQVVSWALNIVSRASVIVRPVPLKRDRLLVLRVDLRAYASQIDRAGVNDLQEWIATWENLQFDPRYSLLLTADTLKFAAGIVGEDALAHVRKERWVEVPSEPYQQGGKTFNVKLARRGFETVQVALADVKDVVLARVSAPHLDPQLVLKLAVGTASQAGLVSADYFLFRSMAAIKDEGGAVWSTLFSGLYYDLSGIRSGAKVGTDLDNLLADLGVGEPGKVDYKQVFDKLRSDQKVAKFHSEVTDGPREVDIIPILQGRIDGSVRLARITNDLKRSNVDVGQHPVMNLLQNKPDAHEVYYSRSNGLMAGALFNKDGARQDEAPPDVARDWTIPAPRHARLQPYIGCISCHEAESSDGFKRLDNDAKKLLANRLEIFADLSQLNRTVPDTLDRVLGAFTGDTERAYARGRDDYAAAVLLATGPWQKSKSQADVVKLAGTKLVGIYRQYDGVVTPQDALRELGVEAKKEEAVALLGRLLPPDKRSAQFFGVPEDPRIAALKAGIPVTRADFALVYSFAMERAKVTIAELQKRKK